MFEATTTDTLITPTDGMVIRSDVQFKPGIYVLPHGIQIDADGVTIDGNGATLVGSDRQGAAISVDGRAHVAIRNVRIRDYYHGITVRNAKDIIIEANHITSTDEVEANTAFLDIWRPVETAYGAAILLDHVEGATVNDNDIQHQMNGLLTYHCTKLNVRRNVASYNSGFGIHLYGTCDSVFEQNWADYCNRYEPRDAGEPVVGVGATGHMGADTTGFLLVYGSCRNVFRRNCARLGGDGFFVAGMTPELEPVPCNDNLFEENDVSLSPNIGFEATFCTGNIFRNNWADRCNFGFWLGYSSRNVLEGNRMLYNRQAGIAAEHGVGMEVRNNDFQSNGTGILLWTKHVDALLKVMPEHQTVRDWLIEKNKFYRNETGIGILADKDHGIRPAAEEDSGKAALRPCDVVIRENDIQDNRIGIHLFCADRTVIEKNKINRNVEADVRREDDRETVLGHNLGMRGAYL